MDRTSNVNRQLIRARVLATGQEVMVDDVPNQFGLMRFYNRWYFDNVNDRFWDDSELEFLEDRLQ